MEGGIGTTQATLSIYDMLQAREDSGHSQVQPQRASPHDPKQNPAVSSRFTQGFPQTTSAILRKQPGVPRDAELVCFITADS